MPDNDKTPADVLREAAERVRTRGLHRGTYVNELDGSVCALGAIYDVRSDSEHLIELDSSTSAILAEQVLKRFINTQCGVPVGQIPRWNDRVVADGEEVAVTMEKAAAHWEETHA